MLPSSTLRQVQRVEFFRAQSRGSPLGFVKAGAFSRQKDVSASATN
jgi:hypothetical protein